MSKLYIYNSSVTLNLFQLYFLLVLSFFYYIYNAFPSLFVEQNKIKDKRKGLNEGLINLTEQGKR